MRLPARSALASSLAGYVLLAALVAVNKLPWCDEGWYGAPAISLLRDGTTATPGFFDVRLPGIREHTFWEMPGFIVTLAGWFALFGQSLLVARALSVVCGLGALALWYVVLKELGLPRAAAVAATALIGTDYFWLLDATYARSDMLSVAFMAGAFASWLRLRTSHLQAAVLVSVSCTVAAGLTHPNAGMLTVIGMLVLAAGERKRLRARHVALAMVPFAVGAILWWLLIRQAPDVWAAQFSRNSSGRFTPFLSPLEALLDELTMRYLQAFGLGAHSSGTPALVVLKAVTLVAWGAGVAGCLLNAELRRATGVRTLLLLWGAWFLFYTLLEGTRTTYYLVWLVPVYSALLAAWTHAAWKRGSWRRWLVTGLAAASLLVQVAASLAKARQHWGMRPFEETVAFVRANAEGRPVVAGIEFGYALGFGNPAWVDDISLGTWSGVRPSLVVIEDRYRDYLPTPRNRVDPAVTEAGRRLQAECRVAFDNVFYTVWRCP